MKEDIYLTVPLMFLNSRLFSHSFFSSSAPKSVISGINEAHFKFPIAP
jgi:hypothetical protein